MPTPEQIPRHANAAPAGPGAAADAPLLLIAPDEARLVTANAGGARAIGLSGEAACRDLPLDSAMPAIARLRRWRPAANGHSAGGDVDDLVFWTSAGLVRLTCRLSAQFSAEGRRLVRVEPLPDRAVHPACAARNGSAARRGDADTLAAIARQIRASVGVAGARGIACSALAPAGTGGESSSSGGGGENGDGDGEDADRDDRAAPDEAQPAASQSPACDPPGAPGVATAKGSAALPGEPSRGSAARRTLVRRIAHELKTPLSAIVAASEIMKDERFGAIGDERYLRYARDIHESARHALDVVQRIMAAQMEAADAAPRAASHGALGTEGGYTARPPALELEFAEIDLNGIVEATLSTLEVLAVDAGVALTSELAHPLPRVVADQTSLRQIVLNLVGNALKFTPRGGTIVVSTSAVVDGPLKLAVDDSGPGMAEDDMRSVLEAEAPRDPAPRPGGGLGIGLPLVKVLAGANGGELGLGRSDLGGVRAVVTFSKSRQIPV